ncbi:MAG: hypothetical protein AB7G38_16325 [Dehalococcoidia bacterium]
MTMNFTDPSELRLSGQNPYMMLYENPDDAAPSTQVSIWHVQYHPEAGPGSVLYLNSKDLTDGKTVIYSDNEKLARWIQDEITGPTSAWKDNTIPVKPASFSTAGDARYQITETVVGHEDLITLTWGNFLPAFAGITAPNPERQSTHGHYAVYVPAQKAEVVINGKPTAHKPIPRKRGDWDNMSAFLAWAESWVRPKE